MTRYFARFVPVFAAVMLIFMFAQAGLAQTPSPAPAALPNEPPTSSVQPGAAPAPTGAPVPGKIGIMNIQAAILTSNEGQRDFSTLQKKFEPKRTELDALDREIKGLKDQLNTTGDKLNEDARSSLVKQIDTKQKALQRSYEDANSDLQNQQNEIANRIGQKMMEVVDKYAKEHSYNIIFDYSNQASQILWAANSVDLTQAIVEAYNAVSGVPTQPKGPGVPASTGPKTTPGTKPASSTAKPAAR